MWGWACAVSLFQPMIDSTYDTHTRTRPHTQEMSKRDKKINAKKTSNHPPPTHPHIHTQEILKRYKKTSNAMDWSDTHTTDAEDQVCVCGWRAHACVRERMNL